MKFCELYHSHSPLISGLGCAKVSKMPLKNHVKIKGKFWHISTFIILTILLGFSDCRNRSKRSMLGTREREKQILDMNLGGSYDVHIRPAGQNGTDATVVHINLFLRSIHKIDDYQMEYAVQLTFRKQWYDDRLRFDHITPKPSFSYLTMTDSSKVWMPDLFFSNEKTGRLHYIIMPNVYIRIFPNGDVLYSVRISLTLFCPMQLKMYPLDKQKCSLRMASYGWTTDDLIFKWKNEDPVQITKDLHLPRFVLEEFATDYCDSITSTGTYSCLRVDILFKREFGYYLLQIYIPCCMLVIVSWVSFWLDQGAVQARVSLGVTTLLTMATQTSGINQSLPPVSYTKALDVWTGVCLTFVFGALLEFALVNYATRSDRQREVVKNQRCKWEMELSNTLQPSLEGNGFFGQKQITRQIREDMALEKARFCEIHLGKEEKAKGKRLTKSWLAKFPTRAKRIDVLSRFAFPIIFAFFNLVYWLAYLSESEVKI